MLPLVPLIGTPEVAAAAIFSGEKKKIGHTPSTLRNRPLEANTEQFYIYYSYAVLNRTSKFLQAFDIFSLFPIESSHVCSA